MIVQLFHKPKCFFMALAVLLFSLSCNNIVFAHKVVVFAYSSGAEIVVEGSFGGKRPAQKSQVSVFSDATGDLLLEGETDSKGLFRFSKPEKEGSLKVLLKSGQGHQAEWLLTKDLVQPVQNSSNTNNEKGQSTVTSHVQQAGSKHLAIDEHELSTLINQAVAKEIEPLKHMLHQQLNKGPGIIEIIGGIGWLFGIAGIAVYLKNRK